MANSNVTPLPPGPYSVSADGLSVQMFLFNDIFIPRGPAVVVNYTPAAVTVAAKKDETVGVFEATSNFAVGNETPFPLFGMRPNQPVNTVVFNLSNPALTYALQSNPNNYFKLVGGNQLQINATPPVGTSVLVIRCTDSAGWYKDYSFTFEVFK